MPEIYHVVYTSRATKRIGYHDLSLMCDHFSEKNDAIGITGLLVYDGLRYMQLIEGDFAVVQRLMSAIAEDQRHDSIAFISKGRSATRTFASWGLACAGFRENSTATEFLADVKTKARNLTNPMIMAHFIGFATLAKVVS